MLDILFCFKNSECKEFLDKHSFHILELIAYG